MNALDTPRPAIHIVIGTPCYGAVVAQNYFMSMLALGGALAPFGIALSLDLTTHSFLALARNMIVANFLESDASHLLFIDSDVGFDPADVLRMIAANVGVCAGVYPVKEIDWERVGNAARGGVPNDALQFHASRLALNVQPNERGQQLPISDAGIIEMRDCTTGFMLIRRDVITRLVEAFPETRYTSMPKNGGRVEHALFDSFIDPETNYFLTEDYAFCRRCQQIGIPTHAFPFARLSHQGVHTWQGDMAKSHMTAVPKPAPPVVASPPAPGTWVAA